MRMRLSGLAGLVIAAGLAAAGAAQAQTPSGQQIFQQRCKSCHEPPIERAPSREALSSRPQSDVVRALTTGVMRPMASGLSEAEIQAVAAYVAPAPASQGPRVRDGDVELPRVGISTGKIGTDNKCTTAAPPIRPTGMDWPNMGVDDASKRFNRNPGLKAADVPRLKPKWTFALTGGGQPTVVGDWLYMTNRSGHFYALDAKSGCVRWVVDGVVARTTPPVIKAAWSPSGWATLVGGNDRIVRAYDAQSGKELWKSAVLEAHPISVLTGTGVVAGDKFLQPISSIEEAAAMSKSYVCCTFRGSLAALDLKTGKLLWKTHTISEPMRKHREVDGKTLTGPAGAAVWAAPSLDLKRGLAYIVTGDSYTDVDTIGADAVIAVEIATGKIRWQHQVTEKDNFVMGCGPTSTSGNCPTPMGPDYDFGATPVLFKTKVGDVLVAGQKSGIVYGMNPDTGKLLWKTQVGTGSALGGVEWGIGGDDTYAYVPVSDLGVLMGELRGRAGPQPARPGVYAIDPATGRVAWSAPAPKAPCVYASDKGKPSVCANAQSSAPAIIPGVVFEGALDGWFRAYDAKTGKVVWAHSTTAQTYDTVNGVKGQVGGGIDGMGPTIANGMVYLVSGNNGAARVGANPVNVLIAYSVDGK